jgi:site-specific recombinase XerD
MNTTYSFRSLLAEDIQRYLDFKRATGRKFDTEQAALRLFDRFLLEYPIMDLDALTPQLIEVFLASRPRTRPRSFNHLLGVIRCFFAWSVAQGRLTSSPVRSQLRIDNSRRFPYVFKPEQVQHILIIAAQLPDNSRATHRAEVYTLIFRLMYALGLRVGEIVRLCHADVDRTRRLLIIRQTKFGKNRLVPIGPKLWEHIEAYLTSRVKWHTQWQSDDPLFSFSNGRRKPIRSETISQTFHHLLPKIELTCNEGTNPPCLHCLRHSFAVQTLLRWYRSGIHPGQKLLHLSTFMGHSDPTSTSWYLTITDDLLAEANRRFERLAGSIPKEVGI